MADSSEPERVDRIEDEVVHLYEEYASVLIRFAFRFTGDKELAQDAVQAGFFRYFLHRKAGNEVQNGRAWLFRVVRNYVMDRLREATARSEAPISDLDEKSSSGADPSAVYEQAEVLRHIPRLLSPRELECVRLRQTGLSYDEIAAALQISPGTVGALLSRALKKLRAALGWL